MTTVFAVPPLIPEESTTSFSTVNQQLKATNLEMNNGLLLVPTNSSMEVDGPAVLNNVTITSLVITGNTVLNVVTASNLLLTGNGVATGATIGSLNVTSNAVLNVTTATNLFLTGNAVASVVTMTSLLVTGNIVSAGATIGPLTITGNTTGTRITVSSLTSTGAIGVSTAGSGLTVKEGSNAKQGIVTLSTGSATVSNTSVTANSRIFLTVQSTGVLAPTMGAVFVSAKTAATNFVITSSNTGDTTSVVAYEIFEPN